MIFQDSYSSLNPRLRVGALLREPFNLMEISPPSDRESRIYEILESVGLRPEQKALFPHQFSGRSVSALPLRGCWRLNRS